MHSSSTCNTYKLSNIRMSSIDDCVSKLGYIQSEGEQIQPQNTPLQHENSVQFFTAPWTAACQASLSITCPSPTPGSCSHLYPSNRWCHLILCHPLLLSPSIFPSIRVFSNESALRIRWPKYWRFSFSISPSNEYSGLISFRMDWFDLLAAQGTLKSLLQHHSSKVSAFLALSFLYSPTLTSIYDYWKNHSFD